MEPNRGNDNNQNKKPEGGDRPKNSIVTALLITVVIVLLFSWALNAVEKRQERSRQIGAKVRELGAEPREKAK